jgi:hypothetical protein
LSSVSTAFALRMDIHGPIFPRPNNTAKRAGFGNHTHQRQWKERNVIVNNFVRHIPLDDRIEQPLHRAILDAVARGQRNLRSSTPRTISKAVGVSDSMVRDKAQALELAGLITSLMPHPGSTPEAYLLTDAGWQRMGGKPLWM